MSQYIQFLQEDGSKILVEVSATELSPQPGESKKAGLSETVKDNVSLASISLTDAVARVLQANVRVLFEATQRLEAPPTEMELSFSIKVTGELGNAVVGKIGGDANYAVRLAWKHGES